MGKEAPEGEVSTAKSCLCLLRHAGRGNLPILCFQALVCTHRASICPAGIEMGQENPARHGEAGHTQLQEVKVVFSVLLLWQLPLISDQSPLNLRFGKSPPDWGQKPLSSLYSWGSTLSVSCVEKHGVTHTTRDSMAVHLRLLNCVCVVTQLNVILSVSMGTFNFMTWR